MRLQEILGGYRQLFNTNSFPFQLKKATLKYSIHKNVLQQRIKATGLVFKPHIDWKLI